MRRADTSSDISVLVLGEPDSGKSGLIRSYVGAPSKYEAGKITSRKAGEKLAIYDSTPLSENRKALEFDIKKTKPQVVLICVDLSQPISNDKSPTSAWEPEIQRYNSVTDYKVIVVGTKSDIAYPGSKETLKRMMEDSQTPYVECSAKTGKNIQAVFDKVKNPVYENTQAQRPDWTAKAAVVTVSGMEPFLREFEKKGSAISSFAAGLTNPEFATVTSMKMDKKGGEELTAKMTASGATILIKIDSPSDAAPGGRNVEISDKNAHGPSLKEIQSVVKDMMSRCEAVASRVGEVVSKNHETGQAVRSNPIEDITIDASKSHSALKPSVEAVIKRAGYNENLKETKQQQASAKAFEVGGMKK